MRNGHFGLLESGLEPEFLDTGLRYFLALSGRNFGSWGNFPVEITPRGRFQGGYSNFPKKMLF